MLSARILASGHYFQPLDDAGLPSLSAALAEVCRQRPRRIDRFTQLALLGSGRCALAHAPAPECGIYLATSAGPMGSNIEVQQAIVAAHEGPMPVSFINTLGGAAAFHVAGNLDLHGPAACLSRSHASLETAWARALLDLCGGVVAQALVGVVEEITLPLAAHRLRLGLPASAGLGEGSHWWLLQAAHGEPARGPALHWHPNLDADALEALLLDRPELPLGLGRSLGQASIQALQGRFPQARVPAPAVAHDSLEALWVMHHAGHDCALASHAGRGWLNLFHCLA